MLDNKDTIMLSEIKGFLAAILKALKLLHVSIESKTFTTSH